MSSQHPPLTCAQFKSVLGKLGFVSRPMKSGTSHEDWVSRRDGKLYKVTVDCPKAPFSQDLIGSMARQAGVSKATIYEIHRTGLAAEMPNGSAPVSVLTSRFKPQEHQPQDGFWCVWDTRDNCRAFGGQFSFLTEAIAIEQATKLNAG